MTEVKRPGNVIVMCVKNEKMCLNLQHVPKCDKEFLLLTLIKYRGLEPNQRAN